MPRNNSKYTQETREKGIQKKEPQTEDEMWSHIRTQLRILCKEDVQSAGAVWKLVLSVAERGKEEAAGTSIPNSSAGLWEMRFTGKGKMRPRSFTVTEEASSAATAIRPCWHRTKSREEWVKRDTPYDNSPMVSFFASLKKEYFYRREYATIQDVERDLFYYIEVFYNRKRLHSSLGYMSPVAYRMKKMGQRAG